MTTKGPSYKQIIVPISKKVASKYIKDASSHISNINWVLKSIKLSIIADFIHIENKSIIISTNNVVLSSNLQKVKKIIKSSLQDNDNQIAFPQLCQSKFYLKIVGISYLNEQSNMHILPENIKIILKKNHIFNDIVLIFRPQVIKISPKSDIVIIWINIWNTQNRSNSKKIINRRFNIRSYIATICKANMKLRVPQCKNCWKWGHIAGICRTQGAKCVKCNGSHLTTHYHHFSWYCKANDKINPPRLETKKGKPCPHTFKYINYKGNHQADSNECLF